MADYEKETIDFEKCSEEPTWPIKRVNKINKLEIPDEVKSYLQSIDFPLEFLDLIKVMEMGAVKHGKDSWRHADNISLSFGNNHASMYRHWEKSLRGIRDDEESGLDHYLHIATRALMAYARNKRGGI